MAAILRVKRRNDEEPLDALVLACKRRKTAENDEAEASVPSDSVKTIVKFAGTVNNPDENVVKHLVKTLGKDELEANYKHHSIDILKKLREQTKRVAAQNRYKVVNCHRTLDTTDVEEFEDKIMTLIDVENTVTTEKDSTEKQDESYVYDLYYAKTEDDMYIDEMVSVHSLYQELVFDTYRNGEHSSEGEHDTEDSNSESNWRNDYPDSDHSEDSIQEDDMREAIRNVRLDESSESEDDFIYGVNEKDVEQYGFKYAMYKARMKEELKDHYCNYDDRSEESCEIKSEDDSGSSFDVYETEEEEEDSGR